MENLLTKTGSRMFEPIPYWRAEGTRQFLNEPEMSKTLNAGWPSIAKDCHEIIESNPFFFSQCLLLSLPGPTSKHPTGPHQG